MNLLDSLLDAIVRLDGDALVMHVGEKPYVVTTTDVANQFRGPVAWGQVELSSRELTSGAVIGMLGQILPIGQRAALDEYGAIEFEVMASGDAGERFTVVAARGGDDIWLEVRRTAKKIPEPAEQAAAVEPVAPASGEEPAPHAIEESAPAPPEPVVVPVAEEAPHMAESEPLQEQPVVQDQPVAQEPAVVPEQPVAFELDDDVEEIGQELPPDADAVHAAGDEDAVFVLDGRAAADNPELLDAEPEWGDEVMTEGELGELLRASAAAIITGDDDRDLDFAPDPVEVVAEAPVDHDAAGAAREALLAEQEVLWASQQEPVAIATEIPTETAAAPPADVQAPPVAPMVTAPEPTLVEAASASASQQLHEAPRLQEPPPPPPRPALVVPLTRFTRQDTATDLRGGGTIERILRLAAARGAATVYVAAQSAPMIRVDGEFSALDGEGALSAAAVERMTADLTPRGRETAAVPSEWVIDVPEIGRVRCVAFRDHRGPGLIFRMLPPPAISSDQLGLPAEVQALCSEADGIVLVAGGRGSGKSTLLTSFVDLINRSRSDHVITIEPQIEFIHENKRSFISQRDVRGDGEAVAAAVRSACREDPDVLIVEDLRTPELVSLALEAAEAGRLVFASVPAPSAVSAIERVLEMFPAERRGKAQASLAGALRGVVSQILLRKLRGGRTAAREVLLNTPAVASLILEGKTFQLPAALENGRRHGMIPFAESLATLVRDGVVHTSHAFRKAPNREQFLAILRRDGIDTSTAERLA